MTDERWEQFVENAQNKFEDVTVAVESWEEEHDNNITSGPKDVVEFNLPGASNRYRVERVKKSLVLEKKMHYSHRAGDTARTEYITSDTEFSHKVYVFKQDDYGEWEEVRAESLGL